MRRKPVRAIACTLTVFGLGLYVGLAFTGSAAAFDGTCSGTACHGSGAHTFTDMSVCAAGTTRYFVDSFLPSQAQRPHLTSFHVTPTPPCTGATVSAPTVDPWPAATVDPDKRPSGAPAGNGVFRIGWTVNVPSGSTRVGTMKATWAVAWTQPADSTDPPATTFQPPKVTHDFVVQVVTPPNARASSGRTVTVKVVVSNDGPDASPAVPAGDPGALVFHTSTLYPIVGAPAGCRRGKTDANCGVRQLGVHGQQSFLFTLRVDPANAHVGAVSLSAKINLNGCHVEESTCLNNRAYVTITPH
jgi:hypothetical protein